ncbi:MAG: hypothetical protein JWL73_3535 [Actinomycetia bacterium]|nr:hypothetical protein [Actinomycetes bacterium]
MLGEAREREARKADRSADFNSWLRETVYPIVDPMLRRCQQEYPFARREERPGIAMRVMLDDAGYFELAAALNRSIRVSWHRDGAPTQPTTYTGREDLDETTLDQMFTDLTIVTRNAA